MMENNYFFLKKVHIKTQSKKKDVLVIFILLLYNPLYYCEKERTPINLIKTGNNAQILLYLLFRDFF